MDDDARCHAAALFGLLSEISGAFHARLPMFLAGAHTSLSRRMPKRLRRWTYLNSIEQWATPKATGRGNSFVRLTVIAPFLRAFLAGALQLPDRRPGEF